MSGREMMTFVHFLPLMIGDLIPKEDEVWLFVLNLIEILDILLCFNIPKESIAPLQKKIEKHNLDYVRLFNDSLKPKFHFLVHYPTVILNSGPPRAYWSFKYEAKHKEFKDYAKCISSRKNVSVSIANKFQMKFAKLIFNDEILDIICEEKYKIETQYENFINENNFQVSEIQIYKQLFYKGYVFKKGFYLTKHLDEMCVYKIKEIIRSMPHIYMYYANVFKFVYMKNIYFLTK